MPTPAHPLPTALNSICFLLSRNSAYLVKVVFLLDRPFPQWFPHHNEVPIRGPLHCPVCGQRADLCPGESISAKGGGRLIGTNRFPHPANPHWSLSAWNPSFIYSWFIKLPLLLTSHPKSWVLAYFESINFLVRTIQNTENLILDFFLKIWKKPSKVEYVLCQNWRNFPLTAQTVKLMFLNVNNCI